ncbi:hypothetical protein A8924_5361 [Saccharopolyspora erythraea NRRL 2338]|uniref:Uncharacterized protein n=1 Tax=Saccharopolyspora erythraea TaxID=1836 RepID=A0ABN1ECD0_SACER|nr:hypothetical protein N599_29480 [Saccharopolyspora erythraea D]PFG97891.1 hypothetical protein A8924_5361 [Saccharopolyspora erythraea NRRL 2338]
MAALVLEPVIHLRAMAARPADYLPKASVPTRPFAWARSYRLLIGLLLRGQHTVAAHTAH